jgi:hypothetical protein
VFRAAVEPIDSPVVVRLQPLAERAIVTVSTAAGAAPDAREIAELRLTVVRQGRDLVQIRRPIMAARGLAARWIPARVVSDELGTLKSVTGEAPPGPFGDVSDPLQVFGRELAPRMARAIAEIEQPLFPARGVRTGDVINAAAGDDGVIRYDSRMVVRGRATLEGRRVLVVDHSFSVATIGPSLSSHGYGLIDLETGFLLHANRNQATATTRAGQTTVGQARVISHTVEPGAPR